MFGTSIYSDDISLLAQMEEVLLLALEVIRREAKAFGLEIK